MNPHIVHRHNHAVVVLDGDVDKASCRALLDAIGTAVDYYGYRLVEIQIDSPGGNGRPLKHLLDRLDLYRVQGVRFRTSALSIASSAGAVLVALGDERVAGPWFAAALSWVLALPTRSTHCPGLRRTACQAFAVR